ncbi:hypothetical protein ACFIQG_19770 [Comamonas odontotermitis]|uniref:hypothetical protein n=1 Tax=Comamonas odontotermitis TaxID=379895 RepID=UPI00366E7EE4
MDVVEKDFLDALRRLKEGTPTHKALKAAQMKGVLKINASNVAMEAARSRTLISMENCRYPRVREMIKQAKSGKHAVPTTHTQLIERLRANLADLKVQRDQYQAEATAHFLARVKAEKTAAQEKAATARIKKELLEIKKVAHFVSAK